MKHQYTVEEEHAMAKQLNKMVEHALDVSILGHPPDDSGQPAFFPFGQAFQPGWPPLTRTSIAIVP